MNTQRAMERAGNRRLIAQYLNDAKHATNLAYLAVHDEETLALLPNIADARKAISAALAEMEDM